MKIILTGGSGLVGSALAAKLRSDGHQVREVRRHQPLTGDQIYWDFISPFPQEALREAEALIHLAGRGIADSLWTKKAKAEIRKSRVESTLQIAAAIQRTPKSNFTFICASAVGFYGDRGGIELSETAARGKGFLADVCEEWEAAAKSAENAAVRVVSARFGMVLSPQGGALKKMLPAFRLNLGAVLGSGKQYMSWIGLNDCVRAITTCLTEHSLSGPVNVCAPRAVTNKEFTETLAASLKRRVFFRAPEFALKLFLGEMAEELMLSSTRAAPRKLIECGFKFKTVELPEALKMP